jgi:uncharacterized protein (TIGR03437 family)
MPRYRYLPLLFLPAVLCGQQLTFATYQGGSGAETTAGIAQDSVGNLYLAGYTTSTNFPATSTAGGGFVTKLSSTGAPVASTLIAGVSIAAVSLDASNNVVVAGTNSTGGFVSKLNSALTQTLWTATFNATPTALALDSSGNVYVTGYAQSGFTTTTSVYQTAFAGVVSQDVLTPYNAFVLKLASNGQSTVYATYLGGNTVDAAYAIAVDSSGDVYVTGMTSSSNFPVTPGAAQSQFGGALSYFGDWYGDAFVTKLDPKGATLLYSTYLGGAAADEGTAITIDANGNAYVAGGTESTTFLAGPAAGTYQTTYAGPTADPNNPDPDGDAFLVKLSPSGSLVWYTYLGGSGNDNATAVALDAAGNIYVAGDNDSTNFPVAGNPVPDCHIGTRPFLAEFNATGAKLLMTTGLGGMGYDTVGGLALDAIHNIAYIAGDVESQVFFSTPGAAQANYGGGLNDSFVSRLDLTAAPALAASCVVNAASFMAGNTSSYPTGAVSPGEIVSLFGLGLGPTPYVTTQLTGAGLVSTSIGGMTVLFDGVAAPLLFASNGQLNAVVPYGINSTTTNMTVKTATLSAGPIPMPVDAAVPAIFLCGAYCNDPSQAAVLNSNYSINTVANPATRGDFVTFYMTGAGLATQTVDGAVTSATTTPPQLSPLPVVTIRGAPAQVLYAGPAPGDVSGALQVTVVVPPTIDFGSHVPLSITIGNYSSQDNVTIAIQ